MTNLNAAVYRKLDSIVIVPYLWGTPRIWTGNLDVARQVIAAGPGAAWFKPQEYSQALLSVFVDFHFGALCIDDGL